MIDEEEQIRREQEERELRMREIKKRHDDQVRGVIAAADSKID